MPLDLVAERLDDLARLFGAGKRHHRILHAVRHEDRRTQARFAALGAGDAGQRQVARQAQHARQFLGMAQTRLQRHRATLREAGQDDARGRDAARFFAGDQRLDLQLRCAQAAFVFAPREVGGDDVVPRAHHVAAVDRHRHRVRMREHEADARQAGQVQFAHERHEVVAVGAQAVQPDDGDGRIRGGLDFDIVQQLGHGVFRNADLGRKVLLTAGLVSIYGPPIRSTQ